MSEGGYSRRQRIGLAAGPLAFGLVAVVGPPPGLSPAGTAVLASTCWIATWWVTEAVPIPVTSLLPLVLFPALGVESTADAAAPYADPVVFLFLGGFLLALAIERWGLHRRIALTILLRAGDDAGRLLLGFMVATGVLSMWVSNTATAMMMVPIGMAVVAQRQASAAGAAHVAITGPVTGTLDAGSLVADTPDAGSLVADTPDAGALDAGTRSDALSASDTGDDATGTASATVPADGGNGENSTPVHSPFGVALLLGIAYAASIGGVATLIGTPPNAILAGVVGSTLGIEIGFLQWMALALPPATIFLFVAWVVLRRTLPAGGGAGVEDEDALRRQQRALGPASAAERRVLAVFALVVVGWLTRPFLLEPLVPGVSDPVIAVAGAVALFVVPAGRERGEFLLSWDVTTRVPWGVLVLIGAGFSLAAAFQSSGLDGWIAEGLTVLRGVPLLVLLLAIAAVVVFLSEVASNSATASLFLPVTASLAASLAVSPLVLMVTVAFAASWAFMLPVGTPPNAIVFGSGYVSLPEMARVGLRLNLLGILLLTVATYLWLPVVWGL